MSNETGKEHAAPGTTRRDPDAQLRHDMRTPIDQIIGYTELIEEETADLGQSLVSDLHKIAQAARNLLELVNTGLAPGARAAAAIQDSSRGVDDAVRAVLREDAVVGADDDAAILVVDDNKMNRDLLSRRLAKRGFKVSTASSGHAALEMIEAGAFDLILLDVMMPGLSGLEVLDRLRENYSPVELPVIMATAKDQSDDMVEAFARGANDYVSKPLDMKVVLARAQTQLSVKRATERIGGLVKQVTRRNRFITKVFGRYMSDEVVERLLETPEGLKLSGENKLVTIMFTDLRGFTPIAERIAAEGVVRILNNYMEEMSELIERYHATQVDFRGDSIVGVFGALVTRDDDAQHAVACAIEMQARMAIVNERNRAEGLPEIEMGIGLHTGEAVVGNVGSEKFVKYTAIGSNVNLAARIESSTVGGQVCISQATLDACQDLVVTRGSMEIQAKGIDQPITLYDVESIGGDFNVSLADHQVEPQRTLGERVAVELQRIDAKAASGRFLTAAITALSKTEATLSVSQTFAQLDNLKLRLAGEEHLGDAYCKVMGIDAEAQSVIVRFTAVPPELGQRLELLR